MSDLPSQFHHYVNCQMARVLTQMDRDPDSPTFGCFDRNYWHYKIRDFPSAILQQGVFTLEAVRTGQIRSKAATDVIERWCVGAVNALARQVDRQGGVDEYYPFERSFPAAAFGLYAVGRLLYDWQTHAPHLLNSVNEVPLKRLAQKLAGRVEQKAMNQQAAGLAGIALAAKVGLIAPNAIQPIADRLFQSQHSEGWFNEYGGPDFGYLSVTLDTLADYYDVTRDQRAVEATDRAIAFLAQLVGADGRLPSTLNCRNTDYVVPYGLVRAASRNPLASWLVETLFQDLGEPTHPIWATDDRYHCHYVFASIVRSLPHLDAMQAAEAPIPSEIWLEGCGYWVYWSSDRQWNAYVAAHKGGLVRIHRQNQPPIVDHGWRIAAKGQLWTSNWWSDEWTIQRQGDEICIRGNCQKTQFHIATPVKHAILRLLAWLFGEKLVPFLKQKMIFRLGKADGPKFERRVRIGSAGVELQDQIETWEGAIATTSPRQNLRHVASADSFSPEEWQPTLLSVSRQPLDRKLQISARWTAGSGS